jgi:hypothetical protein
MNVSHLEQGAFGSPNEDGYVSIGSFKEHLIPEVQSKIQFLNTDLVMSPGI